MDRQNMATIKEKASAYFSRNEPGPDEQTRISLFLMGVKNSNAVVLSKLGFQPMEWLPLVALHRQYHKEIEFSGLLQRATEWSMNPLLYTDAVRLNTRFWYSASVSNYLFGFASERDFFQYLAMSHAVMSEIRFIPLLPADRPLNNPFLMTLYDIEAENGRQIQTQIRLMKDMELLLSRNEKEDIIETQRGIVGEMFCDLLTEVCGR